MARRETMMNGGVFSAGRIVLAAWIAFVLAASGAAPAEPPIDRHAVVARHTIHWNDPAGQLPLGNGQFCVTVDGTGVQTLGGNTMAHWGWHAFPLPEGWTPDRVPSTGTFQQGRLTGGDVFPPGTEAIRTWMFDNPHRANLARIRLRTADGGDIGPDAVAKLDRQLDLWTGRHAVSFILRDQPVRVETWVHPRLDLVAVRIESPLLEAGTLEVAIDFPYPALNQAAWVGDFARADGHATRVVSRSADRAALRRQIDQFAYQVDLAWSAGCRFEGPGADGIARHRVRLVPRGVAAMEFACALSAEGISEELPPFAETVRAASEDRAAFWKTGGAIDLSGSTDARWRELERRIVLSQYLTAVQSSGQYPPAETGLLGIDPWRGQFHMEMVWWHLAHFALWDRWDRADRALGCYRQFTPAARALAEQLGYRGLKWPKSVGPEGRSAPWVGNQVLLWKQPHPIFFAELEYRLRPSRATLEKWAAIVEGTAEHMADYPTRDPQTGVCSLSPAMPPSEQGITRDTVFDLAYWRWGLDMAQTWRERMGLPRRPEWDDVRRHLAPLPESGGVFVHSAEWHDTYTKRAWEHPDPIGVLGMLPPMEGVDRATAHRTVLKVWETWDWNRTWGWDYPWMAMAAARVGEPRIAIEALLRTEGHNHYDERGVNTGGPCPYLPGNGGLLYAAAMMAAGWDGAPERANPGFPDDGSWNVRWEGLKPAL